MIVSAKKNVDCYDKKIMEMSYVCKATRNGTYDDTGIVTGPVVVAFCDSSFANKLIDKRIDDKSSNRLRKLDEKY